MKRTLLALLLCLAMLLPLAACTPKDDTTPAATTEAPETPDPTPKSPVDGFIALTKGGETDFRMVVATADGGTEVYDTASVIKKRFWDDADTTIGIAFDSTEERDYEIIIGNNKRAASVDACAKLAPRDWSIEIDEKQIVIAGGSIYSTCLALDAFAAKIVTYEGDLYVDPELDSDYIYERDNTEDVYGTIDEKHAQYADPYGRPMFVSHRAEHVYSPENSRGGIISAVELGADMIEIDVRRTKDGKYILCHDTTLTRTTNVAEFAGKNGNPTSHNVSDWTLDQLRQLTLTGSLVAEPIVTLDELFDIVRGKALLVFDKIESDADTLAIYRMAFEARAVDSVMFQYAKSFKTYEIAYKETGIAMPYLHYKNTVADAVAFVNSSSYQERECAVQAIQFTTIKTSTPPSTAETAKVREKCRLYVNTLGGSNLAADKESVWNVYFNSGVGIIQTDAPFRMASFIRGYTSKIYYDLEYSTAPVMRTASVLVSLKSDRPGKFYYTTDGSDPTTESTEFTAKFKLDADTTVKAIFVPHGTNEELSLEFNVLVKSDYFYELIDAAKAEQKK